MENKGYVLSCYNAADDKIENKWFETEMEAKAQMLKDICSLELSADNVAMKGDYAITLVGTKIVWQIDKMFD